MVAAIDRDDPPPSQSPAIAALLATVDRFMADNAQLLAENAALKRGWPGDEQLRPLKALLSSGAEYERARRSWRAAGWPGVFERESRRRVAADHRALSET